MRDRLLLALVAVFVVVQLVVPAVMLFMPRPSPFGWQMYTAARSLPDVILIAEDGSEQAIDIGDHLAGLRAEVDYAARFAEQACRLVDAPRIRVIPADGDPVEVDCR